MKINILHLYPESMSLYGEYANVSVLARHLEAIGAEVGVKKVTLDEKPDFSDADLIYLGSGTEPMQKVALGRLLPYAEEIKKAADRGAVILFTGNAFELLGSKLTDASGKSYGCLGLTDFVTVETKKRSPGDVIAVGKVFGDRESVGFVNKCSKTSGITSPLFDSLLLGEGNDEMNGAEGYISEGGNVIGTHVIGPLLVKNPHAVEYIVRKLAALKGESLPDELPVLPYERESYDVTLTELKARLG